MKKIVLSLVAVSTLLLARDTIAPTFSSDSMVSVEENQLSAITLVAKDNTVRHWWRRYTSPVSYSITGSDANAFNVDAKSGVVSFKLAPDFESKSSYSFTAIAQDKFKNKRYQDIVVTIIDVVEDVAIADTTAPVFSSASTIAVNENQTSALRLEAQDETSTVTYSIASQDASAFNIDANSGVISFKVAPDYETKTRYSFDALATDEAGNTATQNIVIDINDVNEDVSAGNDFYFASEAVSSVEENQLFAIKLAVNDGYFEGLTYRITGGDSALFRVNYTTGEVTFLAPPDYEKRQNYSFTAIANQDYADPITQEVTIIILDVEEDQSVPGEVVTFHGLEYGSVVSPLTGRTWLDRNIGASQVCNSLYDSSCFGDYFQWGRGIDGHEKVGAPTSDVRIDDIYNTNGNFIIAPYVGFGDANWVSDNSNDRSGALRAEEWSKTDGSSVCPAGYNVPTYQELKVEVRTSEGVLLNNDEIFEGFLKLPSAAARRRDTGDVGVGGAYYWSRTYSAYDANAIAISATGNANGGGAFEHIEGHTIRCIKAQ